MIIGNKKHFGFQIDECKPKSDILKDVYIWVNNSRIGNEAPHFGTYVNYIEGFLNIISRNDLYFSELADKSDDEIFALLEKILDKDISYGKLNHETVYNQLLIAHWDDALDGWDFYIIGDGERFKFLWRYGNSNVSSYSVDRIEVVNSTKQFISYSKGLL